MMSLPIRRVLVAFVALSFIGLAAYAPMHQRSAYAQIAVIDGANLSVNTASAAAEGLQATIMNVLNGLAWTVAKTAVQSLTQSIVTWINSGFEGSPAFTTDLNRNLGNLADAVAEDFISGLETVAEDTTGFSVRSPYQDQIADALREEFYRTTSSYGFDVRNPYTDCYGGGDFNFDSFFCESQNPANNPYGRYQLARNELFARLDTETRNRLRELDWGNGFLSWRGPCGPYGSDQEDYSTDIVNGSVPSLSQTDRTFGCPIRTPGAVIEDQLVTALGSPVRQLELADSINEIVGALMTQMVNQVLGGGGLSGLSSPASGGGSSYISQAGSSISDGLVQSVATERQKTVAFQSNWRKVANAASEAVSQCSSDSAKSREAERALQTANAGLARATNALTAIDAVQDEIDRARSAAGTQSAAAVSSYQNLISSNLLISPEEQAEAEAESQNSGGLYADMVELEASCGV